MKTINVNLRGGQAEGAATGISFSFSAQEVLVHTAGSREAALAIPVVDNPLLSHQVFRFELSGYQVELEVLEVAEAQPSMPEPIFTDEPLVTLPPIDNTGDAESTTDESDQAPVLQPEPIVPILEAETGDPITPPSTTFSPDPGSPTPVPAEGDTGVGNFLPPTYGANPIELDPAPTAPNPALMAGNSNAEALQGLVARYEQLLRQHNIVMDDALVG